MSDEVNTNANAEAAKYRKIAQARKAKVAELEQQLATLTGERDAARNEASSLKSAPSEAQARIDELTGKLRQRDHRDAFNKLAAGRLKPDALDAAWKLSEWKADTDEVDAESLGNAIGSLIETHGFLAAEAATPDQGESGSPPVVRLNGTPSPVPGLGRGPAPKTTKETPPKVFRLG